MAQPQIGEEVGGYLLQERIASGGMGVVFRARHRTLERQAAVKILAPRLAGDPDIVSRFLSEARIANELRHPCIVDIFDFVDVEHPRRVACIMELLDGLTLAEVVRNGPLRIGQALNVMVQLVDALAAVHRCGVVHRDLKPQNIIVIGNLETDLMAVPSVKILDFGIAKMTEAPTQHRTRTGSVMGTPAYMAPEQIAASEVSSATDLYALAEIFFEMVAGRRVFEGDNLQILAQKMAKTPPKFHLPPTVYGHDRILSLVSACLNPSPKLRPSFADFEAAISDLNEEIFGSADAATVLEIPRASLNDVETDTDDDRMPDVPAMNTQMFFDRISLDIADPPDVADTEPPPPSPMAEEEGHLTLMRSGWSPPETLAPPRPTSHPRRAPSRVASAPRIVMGRPTRAAPRRSIGLIIGVVLALLIAGGAIWWVPRLGWLDGSLGVNPLAADAERWSADHGGYTGKIETLIDQARAHIHSDEDPRFDAALDALKTALVADPSHPVAMALYVEARSLDEPATITIAQRTKLSTVLEHAESVEGMQEDIARARAMLAIATHSPAMGSASVSPYASPAALLRRAEGFAVSAPRKALTTLHDEGVRALPRSVLVRARARRNLGRYRAAADTLAARLTASNVTHAIRLEQALVDAAIHRNRSAASMFELAAEGSTIARLEQGRWLASRDDPSASKILLAIANDKTLQERLRIDALTTEAKRLRRQGESVKDIAALAEDIDPRDPQVIQINLEAALDEGQSGYAIPSARAILKIWPDSVYARVALATASVGVKDTLAARTAIEQAIDRTPHDPRLRILLGTIHLIMQDAAAARAVIDALGELDPHYPRADERLEMFPRAAWLETEKHLLLARADSSLRGPATTLAALLKFYMSPAAEAERALSKAGSTKSNLALLSHGAQLALDRGAKDVADRAVRAMSKIAPKAIAPNLYAARLASSRGRHARAVGIYERLMVASDAPSLRVEHATTLFKRNKNQGTVALREIAPVAMFFPAARRALYDAGI